LIRAENVSKRYWIGTRSNAASLRESLESVVYCFTRYRQADGNTEPAPWKGSGIGEECET
jgi:hypothetical protein